jgi:hypothetical protein
MSRLLGVALLALVIGCRPHTAGQTPSADQSTTIRDVLGGDVTVGQQVSVTGRCLPRSALRAVGGPPVTLSDWQLGEGNIAIYVTGSRPGGCSAMEGSTGPITIEAVVAQDTLPALGNRPATPRRYLVRVVP